MNASTELGDRLTTDILIIDDNDAIIYVMNRILQKQGYDVNAAKSGKEAIDKVSAKFYDLAIIDLNLPDINGLDVYNIITARSPRTKKIILTGLPPEKRGGDTSDEETFDVLVKPLSAEELIQAVKNKLAKPT